MNMKPSKELIKGIKCSMDKNEYKQREKAEVEVSNQRRQILLSVMIIAFLSQKSGHIDTSFLFIKPEWSHPE